MKQSVLFSLAIFGTILCAVAAEEVGGPEKIPNASPTDDSITGTYRGRAERLGVTAGGHDGTPSPKAGRTSLIAPGAKVTKLAGGFRFTEGPAADRQGNIYFSDIPNSRIHRWSVDGRLSTFMDDSARSNGLLFDREGNLVACRQRDRCLASIDPKGRVTVLAGEYDGKRLNSPNDLWIDPQGGIYFTDPRYGNQDDLEQDGEHVYYLAPGRKTLTRVADDLVRPNGIIGTPDGHTLFVADHKGNQVFAYRINPDGSLTDKRPFAPTGSDGLTLDEQGNLYLTSDTVQVYSKDGELIERIVIPERPANVCFGGKGGKTLFVTARTSLYAVPMTVGAGGAQD